MADIISTAESPLYRDSRESCCEENTSVAFLCWPAWLVVRNKCKANRKQVCKNEILRI